MSSGCTRWNFGKFSYTGNDSGESSKGPGGAARASAKGESSKGFAEATKSFMEGCYRFQKNLEDVF